ncbi:MAG: hypothetical protein E4G99_13570 [Anaerolineales bacterium]|nr:MAG: hypothetical protein E4G99_13570 [Anaerolineales bacterium]
MREPARIILAFAIAFAVFILIPPLLGQPFLLYPQMHWADVFDIFTPLVLIPLYWLLFTYSGDVRRSKSQFIVFLLLTGLWVEGQAMHLAANSINNLLAAGSTEFHGLVHFYDEVLSHYFWHVAIVGLSIQLLVINPPTNTRSLRWSLIVPAGVIYGLTCFLAFTEGGTVPFGFPAASLIVLGIMFWRRKDIHVDPFTAFFFVGYLLAVLLFSIWGLYWGGFPEFTEVGLL